MKQLQNKVVFSAGGNSGAPSKRFGKTSKVAKAFICIAYNDSVYWNGTRIIVNGGVMVQS